MNCIKNNLLLFLTVALLFCKTATMAQVVFAVNGSEETVYAADSTARITSFTAKYSSGKVYLHWMVANQHLDGLYIIYRSVDGVNFEVAGTKQGVGVPISKNIGYYFTDSECASHTRSYRLVHVANNKTFCMSDKIIIDQTAASLTKDEISVER